MNDTCMHTYIHCMDAYSVYVYVFMHARMTKVLAVTAPSALRDGRFAHAGTEGGPNSVKLAFAHSTQPKVAITHIRSLMTTASRMGGVPVSLKVKLSLRLPLVNCH